MDADLLGKALDAHQRLFIATDIDFHHSTCAAASRLSMLSITAPKGCTISQCRTYLKVPASFKVQPKFD